MHNHKNLIQALIKLTQKLIYDWIQHDDKIAHNHNLYQKSP